MVTIQQNVTVGANFGKADEQGRTFPRIGDMTTICAGAVVTGPVQIGEFCCVGANAVVVEPVPDGTLVGGVPAKIIRTGALEHPWRTAMSNAIAQWEQNLHR